MPAKLSSLVVRFLQSRFPKHWFRGLSLQEREEILLQLWRGVNTGLDYRQRYLLLRAAYDDRRMKNYPMLSSNEYARVYGLFHLIGELNQVEGHIVECGVGRGVSLAYLVYAVSFFRLEKAVYAFDSFSGFPPATIHDLGSRVNKVGQPPPGWSDTSPELVSSVFEFDKAQETSLLHEHDVRLEIVPGFFKDTLPDKLPSQIAFLHVDCDLYDSTKVVLEQCLPRMSAGGLVILDEYHDERWPGVKKAVGEVCAIWNLSVAYFDAVRRYGIRIPGLAV